MKLRTLWQWPALFIAFLSLTGGAAAEVFTESERTAATVSGDRTDRTEDVAALDAILAAAGVDAALVHAGAPRECRELADRIDGAVAKVMTGSAAPSGAALAGFARLVAAAEALRSHDKDVRRSAVGEVVRWTAGGASAPLGEV